MQRHGDKNGVYFEAWDLTTGLRKTGDSANITVRISKEGTAAAAAGTAVPVEISPGFYYAPLTAEELDGDVVAVFPTSVTANVYIEPQVFYPA